MTIKAQISYWNVTSAEDFQMALNSQKNKNYSYALFFCHLSLEKKMKGLVNKIKGTVPPLSHNLLELSKLAELDMDLEKLTTLTEINTFNIRARYDDYKRTFHKKATAAFCSEYIKKTQELLLWLETYYHKK
jgi:HEPN domain-containing protein